MALSTIDTSSIGGLGYGFKNRLINGAMMIDQRYAGASTTNGGYILDRWQTGAISGATLTSQQVADAPAGFKYSFKQTVTASSTANDYSWFWQQVEGNNAIDFDWGTSNGQTVTVSFWVKSSIAGQMNGSITYYGPTNYYYIPTYTINAANTWQYVTLTIPAPPTAAGAFAAALSTAYVRVVPVSVFSSGYTNVGTGNTWSSTLTSKATGSINIGSTAGATIQFTGVQLEKGAVATSFDWRPYTTELQLCQRYYFGIINPTSVGKWYPQPVQANSSSLSGNFSLMINSPVPMRGTMSVVFSNPSDNKIGWNWGGAGSGYFTSASPSFYTSDNGTGGMVTMQGTATGGSGTFVQGSFMFLYSYIAGGTLALSSEL